MDNFKVEIVSRGREHLYMAMKLIDKGAVAYAQSTLIDGKKKPLLIFYWHYDEARAKEKNITPFPCEIKGEALVSVIVEWLDSVEYPPDPGIDGHCTKGWHLIAEEADGWSSAFMTVSPEWAMHHK